MRCQRVDKTCFSCMPEGECGALEDTDWGGAPCPFYKPTEYDYDTELVFEGKFYGRFKRVRGFGNKYLVSEYGEVINSIYQKMKVHLTERGNPYVKLLYYGNSMHIYLAAVVADAWVEGRGKLDFKDNDPTNCTAENIYRRTPCRPNEQK